MARFWNVLPLVVGATVIATGVLTSSLPASAQLGRVDLAGRSGIIEAVAMGDRISIAQAGPAGDCSVQTQRYWDGFGWRSGRTLVCD